MASKEGMVFKFFEKWKQKRLNKFAKKMLKDNPGLEKDFTSENIETFKKYRKVKSLWLI